MGAYIWRSPLLMTRQSPGTAAVRRNAAGAPIEFTRALAAL
jgi:hypothetical protein